MGLLKLEFSWEEDNEEIQGECGVKLKLTFMGDNVILIQNNSGISMGDLSKEMEEWVGHWLEWVRLWQEQDVCHRRRLWTRWIGVPLHAWCNRFLRLASSNIGTFIKLDTPTENRERLDIARVLVSVSFFNDINIVFQTRINGQVFKIKVMEEVHSSFVLKTIETMVMVILHRDQLIQRLRRL